MPSKFSDFLTELTAIAPRRGLKETQAADLIKRTLIANKVAFQAQEFITKVPETLRAELIVDGKRMPCIGASYTSGKITEKADVLNAFTANSTKPMIIFNPVSHGVCLQTFKSPATVAINRDSVVELVMANEIRGEVIVEEQEFTSQNILVGNHTKPERIIFAHYDSLVGAGAVDNAAAVDVLMQLILEQSKLLEKNLFVFVGSEEECISKPDGCFGFAMFDQKYAPLLDQTKEIIVLDGVGVSEPKLVSDHIDWVFAIERAYQLADKILWMQNDQTQVMKYYHTELDTLDILKTEYIDQARELLLDKLTT